MHKMNPDISQVGPDEPIDDDIYINMSDSLADDQDVQIDVEISNQINTTINMKDITIILGTAHLSSTPGKRSPDASAGLMDSPYYIREYEYSRMICQRVKSRLDELGVRCIIDYPDADMPGLSSSQELYKRVDIVNNICKQYGSKNCLYVSIHLNAAASSGWYNAKGWSVYVSENASENSRKFADMIFDEVAKRGLKTRIEHKGVKYHTANFYVIRKTNCPAVLTENFFQDNKEEVAWLKSEEGINTVVNYHVDAIMHYISE